MLEMLPFLATDILDKPLWMWLTFMGLVLFLLILDLGVFNKTDHEIEVGESLKMSAFYIGIGLLFGGWIWFSLDEARAVEYWTGFVVEKTLAMDNIFVIALIFSYFHIPRKYQHRVLFWGILGVILLRGIMIGFGAVLVHEFEWILYFFAAFLIFTGVKMLIGEEKEPDIGENTVLKFLQKNFRTTSKLDGHNFFTKDKDKKSGKIVWVMTPLFVSLVMVEIADVVFAVDSVPAIFAITKDPYIVYTSNIFAILGLRALYFALAAMIHRFEYLKYALSMVLIFIGSKMFVVDMLGLTKFPPLLSLAVTIAILIGGVLFSLWKTHKAGKA